MRANLARVAAVLGVSIGYLITGESESGRINVETADERALLSLYRQIREPGRSGTAAQRASDGGFTGAGPDRHGLTAPAERLIILKRLPKIAATAHRS